MLKKKRPAVLVIDDDEDYLEILKLGLSDEFEIVTVDRIERLEKESKGMIPSLILLDKNLGSTSSEEVIGIIRKLEPLKNVPILLMSGSDAGRRESSAYHLEGFMVKPASFQEVRDRLRATLSRL